MSDAAEMLAVLEHDGLVHRVRDRYRTTRNFQSAMARAASRLYRAGDAGSDLRVPIASALLEIYGDRLSDDALAARTEAMLPIEAEELNPGGDEAPTESVPSSRSRDET